MLVGQLVGLLPSSRTGRARGLSSFWDTHHVRRDRTTASVVTAPGSWRGLVGLHPSSRTTHYRHRRPIPSPTVKIYNPPAYQSRARLGGSSRRPAPTHTRMHTHTPTHTRTRTRTPGQLARCAGPGRPALLSQEPGRPWTQPLGQPSWADSGSNAAKCQATLAYTSKAQQAHALVSRICRTGAATPHAHAHSPTACDHRSHSRAASFASPADSTNCAPLLQLLARGTLIHPSAVQWLGVKPRFVSKSLSSRTTRYYTRCRPSSCQTRGQIGARCSQIRAAL